MYISVSERVVEKKSMNTQPKLTMGGGGLAHAHSLVHCITEALSYCSCACITVLRMIILYDYDFSLVYHYVFAYFILWASSCWFLSFMWTFLL